jgi:cryptochrome
MAASISAGGAGAAAKKVGLLWFRKGLRLHDNPALMAAIAECHTLYPVFVIDSWFADPARVSANRYGHLLETLRDLDSRLRALNSRLLILRGKPAEVLPAALQRWSVNKLYFERNTEPYAVKRDADVVAAAASAGVATSVHEGHTLYDPDVLLTAAKSHMPIAYQSFLKLLAGLPPPPKPLPAPAAESMPPISRGASALAGEGGVDAPAFSVPTLAEMGYDPSKATTPFRGGETEALARLERHMARTAWVAAFEKPETSPNALQPSTTVLSPYVKFGSLSCRTFYWRLKEVYAKVRWLPAPTHG